MTTNDPDRFFVHDLPRVNLSEMPKGSPGRSLSEQQREVLIAAKTGRLYRDRGRTYLVTLADGGLSERRIGDSVIAELAGHGWLTIHDGLLFPTEEARDLLEEA